LGANFRVVLGVADKGLGDREVGELFLK